MNTENYNLPLISIITVVLNGEKFIEKTIKSVLNQTYRNIEYIIIDGGSTDNTLNIINKYKESIDILISEPDKGLYDAMNKGIKHSNGELIGMVNSDDWYELDSVSVIVDKYIQNNKRIFHGDIYLVDKLGNKTLRKFVPSKFKFIFYGMTYLHPSMFISREIYKNYFYNINISSMADYQFVLEIFRIFPKDFCYLDKPLSNFRLGGISGNQSLKKQLLDGYYVKINSGYGFIVSFLSLIIRTIVFSVFKILNLLKI